MATLLLGTTIGGYAAIHAGNIGAQSVNYASSAGSVTWANVSGKPTALSQFTNDLGNYGGFLTSSSLSGYATQTWVQAQGYLTASSVVTNATNAVNLYGPGASTIRSSSAGTSYNANYQIRENDGGYGNTSETYAPQLAFHWGNVVASSIMMEASGRMAIRNNPGTGYENFIASIIYSSGYGDSTQWNTAYGWGNHATVGYLRTNTWEGNSYIGTNGAHYGTVFYDSNDSAYYVDPNSSSRLRYLYVGDSGSNWSNPGTWDTTVYISGPNHSIIRVENRGNNYHSAVHSHTGQLPGVGSPGDYDYRITRNWSNRMIFYTDYTYAYGYLQAESSLRAPIFYDSNDTTYYLDPNSSTSGYFSGVLLQNNGKYVRDSSYRTYSGSSDKFSGGDAGWYRIAEITLTGNCSGSVMYGTLYDHRYDGADAYQISVVARAECGFTSDNEQHYINVGCSIIGSTNYTDYRSKFRVILSASSSNSRTYELQVYETPWNSDSWQIESNGWTVYTTPQDARASTGTARVNYISTQNADYQRANTAMYAPIYYATGGGNSSQWNTAYSWGNHATAGYLTGSHNHDDRYYTESESDFRFLRYRGVNQEGDFQNFQDETGEVRFDQIDNYNNLSNAPGGYNYGGVLSMRGDNFGFQIWGSHTGDLYYKTQWNNDQYSGWRYVVTSLNIGSQSVSYATSAGSISGFNNPATGATASTIAYRDSAGDLYARYMFAVHFNQSGGNSENPTIGQIWTQNTTDNYVRKSTPAHFISQLGLITSSTIGSQSVNYASSAGSVAWTNVSGRPTNVSSFSNDSGYLTSGGTINSAYRAVIEDTRGGQRSPNDYDDYRVSWEFTNQMPHDSNWLSIMTLQGWHNGYAAWQIQGPATSAAQENWYLRSGINTSWNTARTIIHSGNIGSQSVNYATTAGFVTWTNVGSRPTALSQFTNDLGNYGSWITSSGSISGNAATATRTSGQGGYPHAGTGMFAFYNWGGSNGGTSAPTDSTYTVGISVGSHPGDQAYGFQIGRNMWNDGIWVRGYDSGWRTWYRIIDSSNIGSQSVSYSTNSGQLDGYGRSNYLGKNGNSYYQADTWIQLNGGHGLYAPSYYSAHFYPNVENSYTQWALNGSKNGYGGIYDVHSRVNGFMYDGGGNGGVYREANGLWYFYYHVSNNCMAIGDSGTSGSYRMYVHGSVYATGDIVAYSDKRKKTNIETVDNALSKIKSMRGVFYTKIDEIEKGRQVGVIAQEINEVLPEAVIYASDVDEYGVKYGNIVGVLIEAIKEQQKEIEELKAKLN